MERSASVQGRAILVGNPMNHGQALAASNERKRKIQTAMALAIDEQIRIRKRQKLILAPDGTEIIQTPPTASVAVPPPASDAAALLQMIAAASRDPQVEIEKMQRLLDMRERIMRHEAETAFNRDMLAAQEDMKPIVRDAINRQQGSRYALLETIDRAIRPVYTSRGFCMTFNTAEPRAVGAVRMLCDVRHIGGHVQRYELEGALDITGDKGTPNKSSIKATGSTNSYLRRYLTVMVWNVQLTNEDDDANGADALSAQQVSNVTDMLNACDIKGERLARFLEFAGAASVEEIIQARYADVMTKLRTEHRKQREG